MDDYLSRPRDHERSPIGASERLSSLSEMPNFSVRAMLHRSVLLRSTTIGRCSCPVLLLWYYRVGLARRGFAEGHQSDLRLRLRCWRRIRLHASYLQTSRCGKLGSHTWFLAILRRVYSDVRVATGCKIALGRR